ncbi:MAG: hypothetical protein LBM23_00690 [Propionibacteriaceae bacterium]|nr:hypothetical protein [Propionibacteriaceae bacterium]
MAKSDANQALDQCRSSIPPSRDVETKTVALFNGDDQIELSIVQDIVQGVRALETAKASLEMALEYIDKINIMTWESSKDA